VLGGRLRARQAAVDDRQQFVKDANGFLFYRGNSVRYKVQAHNENAPANRGAKH
jgi:hypothetical protein